MKYPYVVFGFIGENDHPQIWLFDTAKDVVSFLWGRYLPHYAVFKNTYYVPNLKSEVSELEKQLEKFEHRF